MASIDILIPTYSRPAALAATLIALCFQTFRDFRVVISDQTETEDTTEKGEVKAAVRILRAHGHEMEIHRHLPRRGMAEQRQFLLERVSAPYALYLDDDVIVEVDLVERLHRAIRDEGCGFVGSAVIGLIGAWLLARGNPLGGALLVHMASVLDGVDGEVARLRLRTSARGAFLDGILDRIVDLALVAGLSLWALAQGASPEFVVVVAAAAAGTSMLSMASKDRVTALGLPTAPEGALTWLFGGRDARLLLIVILALAGWPLAALVTITATAGLTLLVRLACVYASR
jgi:phosphatidylglycerophosphate synthase